MYKTQVIQLNDAATTYLKHAEAAPKPSDKKHFTSLAIQCFQEARKISQDEKVNTVEIYLEFLLLTEQKPTPDFFANYVEFCLRNKLAVFSQQDFLSLAKSNGQLKWE